MYITHSTLKDTHTQTHTHTLSLPHLESSGETPCSVHALFTILQVGVESFGLVTFPPGQVVVREESASMLDGGQGQLRLVVVIHLCE